MSLRKLIEGTGLAIDACADVLGVDHELFQQWCDGQREMPPSYAAILGATLGVRASVLTSSAINSRGVLKVEPASIWFKFRGEQFTDSDRESILAVRRLGHNANELEVATLGQQNRRWDIMFQSIMKGFDIQAAPQDQGRAAAKEFCKLNQFGHGGTGSSDILRDRLRSLGILLIESPIKHSRMEGCSFYVGDSTAQRPCIFVNTYSTTWFRRNVIIMHELGHALFDQNSGGEIDISIGSPEDNTKKDSLTEVRAEAFAKEALLPKQLLLSLSHRLGLRPTTLTAEGLAQLVSASGVERKSVVQILVDHELIDDALSQQYLSYDVNPILKELTDHALTTVEYIVKIGTDAAQDWEGKRLTTSTRRKLLLPVPYVKAVLDAVRNFSVSVSRAADLLMIDEDLFTNRFAGLLAEISE